MVDEEVISRFKQEMWSKIAEEMAIPWRAAEAMHWQLGEQDMARRAGVAPFSKEVTGDIPRISVSTPRTRAGVLPKPDHT
jgi:hypothetical protein